MLLRASSEDVLVSGVVGRFLGPLFGLGERAGRAREEVHQAEHGGDVRVRPGFEGQAVGVVVLGFVDDGRTGREAGDQGPEPDGVGDHPVGGDQVDDRIGVCQVGAGEALERQCPTMGGVRFL